MLKRFLLYAFDIIISQGMFQRLRNRTQGEYTRQINSQLNMIQPGQGLCQHVQILILARSIMSDYIAMFL